MKTPIGIVFYVVGIFHFPGIDNVESNANLLSQCLRLFEFARCITRGDRGGQPVLDRPERDALLLPKTRCQRRPENATTTLPMSLSKAFSSVSFPLSVMFLDQLSVVSCR